MADLSGSRFRSSGKGSSFEDPDIMEVSPSLARSTFSNQKQKRSPTLPEVTVPMAGDAISGSRSPSSGKGSSYEYDPDIMEISPSLARSTFINQKQKQKPPPALLEMTNPMAGDAISGSRFGSSGKGSSFEDPDIMEISPSLARITSSNQKQKRKRIHQVVPRDVVEIDEDNDLDAVEIISIRNSDYKTQNIGSYKGSHHSIKDALPYTPIGTSTNFGSKNVAPHSILNNSEHTPKSLYLNEHKTIVEDEIDMKFKSFKQFDIVQDHSDHTFSRPDLMTIDSESEKEIKIISPPKSWIKRIHYELKILKDSLPEAIYVRAYEGRMDLLRAVIIGAAGTPYHDGLFFFDVYFHPRYPRVSPIVVFHSIGLDINPNLNSAGSICLSLLGRYGKGCELWCPSKSTMLQVLVSLQGLVLTANPLFTLIESFFHGSRLPNRDDQMKSRAANKTYFLASCRTMLYSLRKPPKHFEDLIAGHFRKRGRAILTACLAYLDGAQIGCADVDGIQYVDEGDSSFNSDFRSSLGCLIGDMIMKFTAKGADCNDLKQKVNAIAAAAAAARAKTGRNGDTHSLQEIILQEAITQEPLYKKSTAMDVRVIYRGY